MKRRLDALASALMLVVLACWVLFFPIAPAGRDLLHIETAPIPAASACIGLPVPDPEPTLTPELEELGPLPAPAPNTYDPAIPLSAELQAVLHEACEENDVPVALALGVIEVESCFQTDAVSPEGCYGLMQLNPKYFPDKLSPEGNLRAGIEYLGRLLGQYDDPAAALTVYHDGHESGRRGYANAVLATAEWWGLE